MNRALSMLLVPSLLTAASLTGCDPGPEDDVGDKVVETSVVRAPLNDSFVTQDQPALATAGGLDRYLAVWIVVTGSADLVVGQMFSTTGVALSSSRVYANNAHPKMQPGVSFDPVNRRFLIVYEDRYSNTDDDILGVIVDETGASVATLQIDFSTMFEQQPAVTFVGGAVNKWLVTYEKFTNVQNTTDHRVRGRYVDFTGAFGLTKDITLPSSDQPIGPQAQFIPSTGRLATTFLTTGGSVQMLFGPASTLTYTTTAALVPAAHHVFYQARGAVNSSTNALGIAFLDIDTGASGPRQVRLKTFAAGCESFICAQELPTLLGTSATITGVSPPQIATLNQSFILYAGQAGSGLPNGDSISFVQAKSTGGVTAMSSATIPACATNRTNSLGGNAVMAAGTLRGQSNVNLIYDTYCPGASKVMGQAMTIALARTDYRVSD